MYSIVWLTHGEQSIASDETYKIGDDELRTAPRTWSFLADKIIKDQKLITPFPAVQFAG
jgi:hypothetical protein